MTFISALSCIICHCHNCYHIIKLNLFGSQHFIFYQNRFETSSRRTEKQCPLIIQSVPSELTCEGSFFRKSEQCWIGRVIGLQKASNKVTVKIKVDRQYNFIGWVKNSI